METWYVVTFITPDLYLFLRTNLNMIFYFNIYIGPKLPYKLRGSAMITSPTGRGVVVIGGYNHNEYKYSNAVLELTDNAKKWITLEQSLQYSRSNHITIPVPDEFTNCLPGEH